MHNQDRQETSHSGVLSYLDPPPGDISTGGVANVVSVSTYAQILIDASLDAVARAAETDVDTAVNEAWRISAAVDY